MEKEEKKDLFKSLVKQSMAPDEDARTLRNSLPVKGKKVVINHFNGGQTRLKVVLSAVPEVARITKAQKADLVVLRDRWVTLHNAVKARRLSRSAARKALNQLVKVSAFRLIPADRYDELVAWLKRRIGSLESRASGRVVPFSERRSSASADPDCDKNPADLTPARRAQTVLLLSSRTRLPKACVLCQQTPETRLESSEASAFCAKPPAARFAPRILVSH